MLVHDCVTAGQSERPGQVLPGNCFSVFPFTGWLTDWWRCKWFWQASKYKQDLEALKQVFDFIMQSLADFRCAPLAVKCDRLQCAAFCPCEQPRSTDMLPTHICSQVSSHDDTERSPWAQLWYATKVALCVCSSSWRWCRC